MKATIGRIVHYKISGQDQARIEQQRTSLMRVVAQTGEPVPHQGNYANQGDVFPMVIVRAWSDKMVNGQVLLDGVDTLWVTSVAEGDNPGQWAWPTRES